MKWALMIFISIGFALCGYTIFLSTLIIDSQEHRYAKLKADYDLVKRERDSLRLAAPPVDTSACYTPGLQAGIISSVKIADGWIDTLSGEEQIDTLNFQPLEGGHIPHEK
jgi:hypothetical protein